MKQNTTVEQLCQGLPEEFTRLFTHIQTCGFHHKPDYAALRRMFRKLFVKLGFEYDFVYDWTVKLFVISKLH
jgi:hypothetical protein